MIHTLGMDEEFVIMQIGNTDPNTICDYLVNLAIQSSNRNNLIMYAVAE